MEANTTLVTNGELENVVEETVERVGAGTFLTGGLLVLGAGTAVYGLVKGIKFISKKVKAMAESANAEEIDEIEELEEVEEDSEK